MFLSDLVPRVFPANYIHPHQGRRGHLLELQFYFPANCCACSLRNSAELFQVPSVLLCFSILLNVPTCSLSDREKSPGRSSSKLIIVTCSSHVQKLLFYSWIVLMVLVVRMTRETLNAVLA